MLKSDLKNMVSSIQHEDDDMEKEGLKPVLEALVKKHNGAVEIMSEIKKFLEDAIPKFAARANEKGYWEKRVYNDSARGCKNPYNCLVRLDHANSTHYWVDDTVGAELLPSGDIRCIELLTNSDYTDTSIYCGDSWNFDKLMAWTYQDVQNYGDNQIKYLAGIVDRQVGYANKCLMKLELMLKKIADSVHKRHEERNALIDGASTKKRKVTITIVEEN